MSLLERFRAWIKDKPYKWTLGMFVVPATFGLFLFIVVSMVSILQFGNIDHTAPGWPLIFPVIFLPIGFCQDIFDARVKNRFVLCAAACFAYAGLIVGLVHVTVGASGGLSDILLGWAIFWALSLVVGWTTAEQRSKANARKRD